MMVRYLQLSLIISTPKFLVLILQLLWVETPTNPTMKIVDIEGACKIAHKYKVMKLFSSRLSRQSTQ